MMVNKTLLAGLFVLMSILTSAQNNTIYQNASFQPYDRYLYNSDNRFHTSIKPYDMTEVSNIADIDTLYKKDCKNKIVNYLLNKDLISLTRKDFHFAINPKLS